MRYLSILFILFFGFVHLAPVSAQDDKPAKQEIDPDELKTRIDGYVKPLAEVGHLSGTFLLAKGDKVLYERSWGFADREKKSPLDRIPRPVSLPFPSP